MPAPRSAPHTLDQRARETFSFFTPSYASGRSKMRPRAQIRRCPFTRILHAPQGGRGTARVHAATAQAPQKPKGRLPLWSARPVFPTWPFPEDTPLWVLPPHQRCFSPPCFTPLGGGQWPTSARRLPLYLTHLSAPPTRLCAKLRWS